MPNIIRHSWVLMVLCCHLSGPCCAQAIGNDSLFQSSTLSAARLSDAGTNRPVFLSGAPVIRLFIFLSPECPLCQNYTRPLNMLKQQYGEKVQFWGIIPGKTYTRETILAFAEKYKINYPLLIDSSLRLSRSLHASVTPEVILLNAGNELVYKGAIDNWLKELGKQRTKATENYLQDAIVLALQRKFPSVKRTKAIGCGINDF